MTQDADESKELPHAFPEPRDTVYYTGHVTDWFSTRPENDKGLPALSSASIGLLVSVLVNMGARTCPEVFHFGAAFLAFFFFLWASLIIVRRNSDYIEDAIQGKGAFQLRLKRCECATGKIGNRSHMTFGFSRSAINGAGDVPNWYHAPMSRPLDI
ncbi:MAG: hypothetical protein NTW68_12150 [candidate division NC10 bacterium]|nr:hypothetical protein [candidate division NC10 bacterium]